MENLTSDTLFYRSLIGLIIGPFFIVFFMQTFMVNSFPEIVLIVFYILILVFIVFQWFKELKYKKVSYCDDRLRIQSYFTKKYFDVPFSNVIRIEKAFSVANKLARMSYKVTFKKDDKVHSIYFFKSLALYSIDDIASYIGFKNNVE